MSATPIISVVSPSYLTAGYLPPMVESLLGQSEQRWELIIVDDASPDSTGEVAAGYAAADSRISVVTNQTNLGLGEARNVGIDRAKGDYIMLLDADDWLFEEALTDIVHACVRSRADLIWFDYARVYPGGTTNRNKRSDVLAGINRSVTVSEVPDLLWIANLVTNKAYRSAFWFEHGFRFDRGYYEDIPIAYRTAFLAESIEVVDRACLAYRQRPGGSITSTSSSSHMDLVDRYRTVFSSVRSHPSAELFEPIIATKFERFVDQLLTRSRHRLETNDIPVFIERAADLYQEFIGDEVPDRWHAAEPTQPSEQPSVRRLLSRRPRPVETQPLPQVVILSGGTAGVRSDAAELASALQTSVIRYSSAEDISPDAAASIAGAQVLITDSALPDSITYGASTAILDVGARQSFLQQGVLASSNPLTRPKPLARHLRSSSQWTATIAQGSSTTDTLRAAFPGNYRILTTGMPRNDRLVRLNSEVDPGLCLFAPYRKAWQLHQPITPTIRAANRSGFRVVVFAPWLAEQDVPWDAKDPTVRLARNKDLEQLLRTSAVFITDVSPLAFDFAVTRRPVIIDAPSAQQHLAMTDSILDPTVELPTFSGTDELQSMLATDLQQLRQQAGSFADRHCNHDAGNATEQVVAWVAETLRDTGNRSSLTTT